MKVWLKICLCLFMTISWAACAQNSASSTQDTQNSASSNRAAAEDDIAEAVFRYQFDHNASAVQKGAEKYCLSLPGEKMPSVEFLQRFEGNRPPVVAADQCGRQSGKNLFFRVQKFDWRKDDEVWVRGGYWEGNLSSSIELYQVVRKDGKWTVKGARMEAIS